MPDDRPTLADLPIGAEAVVAAIDCPRPVARRLMEMGVLPGTSVAVVRVAPLGDPIELAVRSCSLSIRRREAACIVVRDVRETAAAPVPAERAVP
ncbi:MAG: ferrous iron transport protein A [Sandaracinaceae bacterium]|nr:ferrous iron transport protein A [Sandaracinaceae bacterium]